MLEIMGLLLGSHLCAHHVSSRTALGSVRDPPLPIRVPLQDDVPQRMLDRKLLPLCQVHDLLYL